MVRRQVLAQVAVRKCGLMWYPCVLHFKITLVRLVLFVFVKVRHTHERAHRSERNVPRSLYGVPMGVIYSEVDLGVAKRFLPHSHGQHGGSG